MVFCQGFSCSLQWHHTKPLCVCVCECVRACVRARARVCVCVCVCVCVRSDLINSECLTFCYALLLIHSLFLLFKHPPFQNTQKDTKSEIKMNSQRLMKILHGLNKFFLHGLSKILQGFITTQHRRTRILY